ncbi:NAD(P)/FAD-dependent oxidoreductase [Gordonia sp. (in: high G+C Gram-positive bacteria)]|uniref:NAD(P)/FAD-dependent oxidoreductase n=1 Tax=Gordonia sp. (in: high G+C Gram-positive bacteria) TaxID=84139 RepID=UPI0039E5C769
MGDKQRVVVLGGGYAGTTTANRLARSFDVVLVNERDRFVERIRLHQWAAGTGGAARDFSTMLAPGVRLFVDTATAIDAPGRTVALASGAALPYDYLVYALGSGAPDATIPGAAEHGHRLEDWESADALRERLAAGPRTITVVGAGLTGVEAAAEFGEQGHRVTLLSDGEIAPSISDKGRATTRDTLARLGVEVRENAEVVAIGPESVRLADGVEVPAEVTVVTAGFAYPDLARRSGLTVDDDGRLRTDAALVSVGDDRIVGTGDAVAPSGVLLRNSCQAAIPLGSKAAAAVLALASGKQPKPVDQGFVAQCLSLGRGAATLQLTSRDDTPNRAVVGGRTAALVKETICRTTIIGVRHPRLFRWVKGGPTQASRVAATAGR